MNYPDTNICPERQKDKRAFGFFPALLLLFLLVFIAPQKADAQNFNPLISFSVESCTLDVALEKLFGEYELNVAFSKAELSKIRIDPYSCSYKSVDEVLADLLKGTDYGFKRIGKQYVIRKNKLLANDPDVTVTPPAETTEVVKPKPEAVTSKTGDTIYIFDTVQLIKTVMRRDTIIEVRHEVKTDTVYEVKYQGWEIPWPEFHDNGWFVTPSMSLSVARLDHDKPMPEMENGSVEVTPSSAYSLGLDAGYKHNRLSVGLNLSYRSLRYRFLLEKTVFDGDYYVNDTLDTYYTIHPTGDTTYQYILDSTYVPLTTTNYAYRDINRLDYMSVGLFATFDFVKKAHFRAFVKAGASMDFLVNYGGSLNASTSPFHAPIAKEQVEPFRLAFFGGLGCAVKVVNRLELVPEVHYRMTNGSLYRADFPFDMKLRLVDFRLGLTYYF